jgi:hypothetical protein
MIAPVRRVPPPIGQSVSGNNISSKKSSTVGKTNKFSDIFRSTVTYNYVDDDAKSQNGQERQRKKSNNFRDTWRDQAVLDGTQSVAGTVRNHGRSGSVSISEFRSAASGLGHSNTSLLDLQRLPPYDPQRRALRSWLRDTLSIRTVGHHKETAAFLLLGAIRPKEKDIRDMQKRTLIDEARRQGRVNIAQGAAERTRVMHEWWVAVESECVNGGG